MRITRLLVTGLAIAGGLSVAINDAKANLLVAYSVNGGALATVYGPNPANYYLVSGTQSFGSITAQNTQITSDSPGSAAGAQLLTSTFSVSNSSSVAQTIRVVIADNAFTAPVAPPSDVLTTSITENVTGLNGIASTVSSFSCVTSPAASPLTSCPVSAYTTPTASVSSTSGSVTSILVPSLAAPFDMTEEIDVTLAGNSTIQVHAAASLTPVPEPASIALLGVSLFGLGMIRRRRAR